MRYFIILLTFLLSACSIRSYQNTVSKIIIIKSPKIKFADLGYIRSSAQEIELELFVAGNSIDKITIDHFICTNVGCLSKKRFNEDYLYKEYPEDILQNILLGKVIYNGKNIIKVDGGYEQKISTADVMITYKVNTKQIFFKDIKNNILIKIKEMDV